MTAIRTKLSCLALLTFALSSNFVIPGFLVGQTLQILPEQRIFHVRSPEQLPAVPVPAISIPFTVSDPADTRDEYRISLDEAIQIAVRNAEVVRVLTGISAASGGRTIYDVAISNTLIDQQNSIFDPTFDIGSTMSKTDRPGAIFDPFDPSRAILVGSSTDSINTTASLSKRNFNGATLGINATAIGSYFEPGVVPLEPENRSSAEISLRQPFARGYGRAANMAPVVVARIDTERSYFQFKDSVQELVRGVISAYWNLVAARVEVWARKQQIEQAQFSYDRIVTRQQAGMARVADVAQARSALANFRASLITAQSTLLLSETALRNILGFEPSNTSVFVPTSTPQLERVEFDWNEVLAIAEQYRPDIIELKLILQADQHLLLQADNQAKPQFDGIANYRWDGLSGQMPSGAFLNNQPGRFAGFNLGVNFSVPIGLRQGRAALRRQELLIARDRANLEQGVHQMVHQLTINYRNLDQFFEQTAAFKEAREAARLNYENQFEEVLSGRREFINLLQAITDWGNAVSQEARSITQYNSELANVERQSGTILETHGIRFIEEQYGSLGPSLMGVRRSNSAYPERISLEGSADRYAESNSSSDEAFNLEDLNLQRQKKSQQRALDEERIKQELQAPRPEIEAPKPPNDRSSLNPEPSRKLKAGTGSGQSPRISRRLRDLMDMR